MNLKEKIFANPKNRLLLTFYRIQPSSSLRKWGETGIPFEGDTFLFEDLAADLPKCIKYQLGIHSILVNDDTGLIFCLLYGRFTFICRSDLEKNQIKDVEKYQLSYTLDDQIDIRELGENWVVLNDFFEDNEHQQLKWSYELSKKTGK